MRAFFLSQLTFALNPLFHPHLQEAGVKSSRRDSVSHVISEIEQRQRDAEIEAEK